MKQLKSSLSPCLYLSLLLFVIICSACTSTSAIITTPKKAPTPTATATPFPVATPLSSVTEYTGPNFSINHPNGWQLKKGTNNDFQTFDFTGPEIVVSIATDSLATGNDGPDALDQGLSGRITSIASTLTNSVQSPLSPVTIDGMQWKRATISGDSTSNGYTDNWKIVVAVVQHPKDGVFYLVLETLTANFDSDNASFFQPLQASFKFK